MLTCQWLFINYTHTTELFKLKNCICTCSILEKSHTQKKKITSLKQTAILTRKYEILTIKKDEGFCYTAQALEFSNSNH